MEFNFQVQTLLGQYASTNMGGIAVLRGDQLRSRQTQSKSNSANVQLEQVLDKMGEASAKSQGLPQVITTLAKLCANDHTIFIKAEGNKCIGFIKVGVKKLFTRTRSGNLVEMKPVCVLDFYVDNKVQRGGYGKQLFDAMLEYEKQSPAKLAYDRPSPKLIGFMAKHYGLKSFVTQNNSYVVFDEYFNSGPSRNGHEQTPGDAIRQMVEQEKIQNERRQNSSANIMGMGNLQQAPHQRFQQARYSDKNNLLPLSSATTMQSSGQESNWSAGNSRKGLPPAHPGISQKELLQMAMANPAPLTYYPQSNKVGSSLLTPKQQQVGATTNAGGFYQAYQQIQEPAIINSQTNYPLNTGQLMQQRIQQQQAIKSNVDFSHYQAFKYQNHNNASGFGARTTLANLESQQKVVNPHDLYPSQQKPAHVQNSRSFYEGGTQPLPQRGRNSATVDRQIPAYGQSNMGSLLQHQDLNIKSQQSQVLNQKNRSFY